LARALGMPASALRNSIGQAPVPLATAPYYALGPLHAWNMVIDGGLAVSPRFEVLREPSKGGGRIDGLYAVGSAGQGGVLVPGHGQHIGWAFTSGRLCGKQLAKL